ncbi:hypothetical protein PZB74_01260 [Porifericola rhodea]|uniref:hypothetical protein n=1 Tax=Porifericola rhodea TaxID=930972 RepID=UPI002666A79C|nr:hypothetical protein [Porifericola rhodea]WKN31984.1 hypothetical protein PZB74_01260 [Porifericola rhodea]
MKRIFFVVLFSYVSLSTYAQEKSDQVSRERNSPSNSDFFERVSIGGNFGLQFGSVTYIDLSPMIGYRFTDKFTAGPGFTYRYLKYKGFEGSSIYGGSLFARHLIGSQFFAQTQFESLNTEYLTYINQEPRFVRDWVSGFFIGGGLYQPLGRRGAILLSAMYNVMYDSQRSPYNSPWVLNVGFTL